VVAGRLTGMDARDVDGVPGTGCSWVESFGGPLLVVPVSAVGQWSGSAGADVPGEPDDYDRACAVDDLAGVIPVGADGALALVLADEPAMTCYLPQHRAFLRWLAAESEADLVAAAEAVLVASDTVWEECGIWETDGPATLMDSADVGAELNVTYPGGGEPEQAGVAVPAGRWRIRAVQAWANDETEVGLVQMLPAD
jgi:hypothetical protein